MVADLGSLGEKTIYRRFGGAGAAAIGSTVAAIAFVELLDQGDAPEGVGAFGFYQGVHLIAPDHAVLGATKFAKIMYGAQYFGKPIEFVVIGLGVGIGGGVKWRRRKHHQREGQFDQAFWIFRMCLHATASDELRDFYLRLICGAIVAGL